MHLDSATLWTAIGTAAVVIGGLQVLQYRLQRDEVSMLFWGAAKLIGAVGAILLALRGQIPDLASVLFGNMLITFAVAMNAAGTVSFNGTRVTRWVILVPPMVMAAGYLMVPDIETNIPAQTIINGVCVCASLSWSAIRAHQANSYSYLMWRRGLAIVQWIWVATMIIRMTASIRMPEATDPAGNSATQAVTALCLLSLVVMLGVVEMLASRERVDRQLAAAALRDAQTGIYNRAGLAGRVERLLERREQVAVILMDLDDFKAMNDRFGHPVGDRVLAEFVRIAASELRSGDVLARYGGDEFCAILPGLQPAEAAAVAERIRSRFSACSIDRTDLGENIRDGLTASVSIGVSGVRLDDSRSFEHVLGAVDEALYSAKSCGRDRVVAVPCPVSQEAPVVSVGTEAPGSPEVRVPVSTANADASSSVREVSRSREV